MKALALAVFFGAPLLLNSNMLSAAPISYGALSSNDDGSTEVIYDSLNNREWLRWNLFADLTYAETVSATSAGGAYADWTIARNSDAHAFTNAFLQGQTNSCGAILTTFTTCSSTIDVDYDALLGRNYSNEVSKAWFLSDTGVGEDVGLLRLTGGILDVLITNPDRHNIPFTDRFSGSGDRSNFTVSWLVYRDVTPIPVPAALPLLLAGLGSLGMIARRRRKS